MRYNRSILIFIVTSIALSFSGYASPVYVAKDSREYHRDRNCAKLITTDSVIEFNSPQKAIAAGGILCEHCKSSTTVKERISESKKNVNGDSTISNTSIGTQGNNKPNKNIERYTGQRSKPKSQNELSEQTRREIYKEIHYAKDRAWSEKPSDASNRKWLREKYKQEVRQKYNITKEVYKRISIEGARNSWYVPPFSRDEIYSINDPASEGSAQALKEIPPLVEEIKRNQTSYSEKTQSINAPASEGSAQALKEIPPLVEEIKRNQTSYSDKTQNREKKSGAFSLLHMMILILIIGLIIGAYIIAKKLWYGRKKGGSILPGEEDETIKEKTQKVDSPSKDKYFQFMNQMSETNDYEEKYEYARKSLVCLPFFVKSEIKEHGVFLLSSSIPALDYVKAYLRTHRNKQALEEVYQELSKTNDIELWLDELSDTMNEIDSLDRLHEFLSDNPGSIQSELGKTLGIPQRLVSDHLSWAEKFGLIHRKKNGSKNKIFTLPTI